LKQNKNIFLLLLSLCAFALNAQKVTVHFEGTVYNEENEILKGATVEVKKDAAVFNFFRADESGNYNLYLPLNAEYDITISKPGYVQKKYFVSTKNIPAEKSQIQFATNVADVVLYAKYDGVDYSLFDRPMNRYFYNGKKDNVHYDEKYLEEMKLAMKQFKKMQGEALARAKEKAKADKNAERGLAVKAEEEKIASARIQEEKQKAEEKIALEKAVAEAKMAKEQEPKAAAGKIVIEEKADKTVVATSSVIRHAKDPRIAALLDKYRPGVTEEIFEGPGVTVIQRVLVRDDMVWIYQKKIFSWGGVAFFRDRQPISELAFEQETKKS
jgi:hypothetical protein